MAGAAGAVVPTDCANAALRASLVGESLTGFHAFPAASWWAPKDAGVERRFCRGTPPIAFNPDDVKWANDSDGGAGHSAVSWSRSLA
jgi:hypothetical protein